MAAKALAALAHEDRLRAFRLLMRNVPEGLRAGDISRSLKIPPSSLSFHLGVLKQAGLVRSHRFQRSIVYNAVLNRTQAMLKFLVNDCCQDHPGVCGFEQTGPASCEQPGNARLTNNKNSSGKERG